MVDIVALELVLLAFICFCPHAAFAVWWCMRYEAVRLWWLLTLTHVARLECIFLRYMWILVCNVFGFFKSPSKSVEGPSNCRTEYVVFWSSREFLDNKRSDALLDETSWSENENNMGPWTRPACLRAAPIVFSAGHHYRQHLTIVQWNVGWPRALQRPCVRDNGMVEYVWLEPFTVLFLFIRSIVASSLKLHCY